MFISMIVFLWSTSAKRYVNIPHMKTHFKCQPGPVVENTSPKCVRTKRSSLFVLIYNYSIHLNIQTWTWTNMNKLSVLNPGKNKLHLITCHTYKWLEAPSSYSRCCLSCPDPLCRSLISECRLAHASMTSNDLVTQRDNRKTAVVAQWVEVRAWPNPKWNRSELDIGNLSRWEQQCGLNNIGFIGKQTYW